MAEWAAPPKAVDEDSDVARPPPAHAEEELHSTPVGRQPSSIQGEDGAAASTSVRVVRGPSLYLAIIGFFGGYWLNAYFIVLLALVPMKLKLFSYPGSWQTVEVLLLVGVYGIRRLQQTLLSYGDRASNAGAVAAALGLLAPVLAAVGYFATLQVYVLQLEFVSGVLAIILLALEVFLATLAGALLSSSVAEKTVTGVASLLTLAVLVSTIVTVFSSSVWTANQVNATLVTNAVLSSIGVAVAGFSAVFLMLDL
eukprot:TRINITY_DN81675_c0_g1_i1.p1 TRINITY_DN81675_c0_g1~~TRINITY_DN81675_c0_g1_i1.p1  ORF type:complete len:254 (+),score=42.19 TRINITY_DN81675_c0_g1_i1:107-868(+)